MAGEGAVLLRQTRALEWFEEELRMKVKEKLGSPLGAFFK